MPTIVEESIKEEHTIISSIYIVYGKSLELIFCTNHHGFQVDCFLLLSVLRLNMSQFFFFSIISQKIQRFVGKDDRFVDFVSVTVNQIEIKNINNII